MFSLQINVSRASEGLQQQDRARSREPLAPSVDYSQGARPRIAGPRDISELIVSRLAAQPRPGAPAAGGQEVCRCPELG